jgi:hypothetical protein
MKYIIQEPDLIVSTSLLLYDQCSICFSVHPLCSTFLSFPVCSTLLTHPLFLFVCLVIPLLSNYLCQGKFGIKTNDIAGSPWASKIGAKTMVRIKVHLRVRFHLSSPKIAQQTHLAIWCVFRGQ